jgi:hypothetical protein
LDTQRNGEHGKPWHVSVSSFEGNWRLSFRASFFNTHGIFHQLTIMAGAVDARPHLLIGPKFASNKLSSLPPPKHSFQGIHFPPSKRGKSVTYVSGMTCHLCVGLVTNNL